MGGRRHPGPEGGRRPFRSLSTKVDASQGAAKGSIQTQPPASHNTEQVGDTPARCGHFPYFDCILAHLEATTDTTACITQHRAGRRQQKQPRSADSRRSCISRDRFPARCGNSPHFDLIQVPLEATTDTTACITQHRAGRRQQKKPRSADLASVGKASQSLLSGSHHGLIVVATGNS
jgi:hypothetical protein